MMPERAQIRFLLDEHHPGWLAEDLAADGIDAVALTAHRPGLRGVDDQRVLEAAAAEHRVVVTEDVSTFGAAATLVPSHLGIVYCTMLGSRAPGRAWRDSARPWSCWPQIPQRASVSTQSSGGLLTHPAEVTPFGGSTGPSRL
jgi:predicted nuclease of predicted toxin-antitoxin system